MNYVIYRLYLSFEGTREGRVGSSNRNGPVFLFFYSHFRPWPPCQPQPPPLPWTMPMTMPNDDSRAEGDDDKDKGLRRSLRLKPWYVFFFLLILFFYTHFFFFLFLFQAMTATSTTTTTMNGANDDAKRWQQGRGRRWWEWGLEMHIASRALVCFFSYQFFFSHFISFFIHFRLCLPCSPQPPPPLPSWTAPMMMPNNDSRAEGNNGENEGLRRISSWALVCFLFFNCLFTYLNRLQLYACSHHYHYEHPVIRFPD